MSITQPVRVFVALGTQHAMRSRHTVIRGLPTPLYNIFPCFLKKTAPFAGGRGWEFLNTKSEF